MARHLPVLVLGVVAAFIAAASAQTPRPQLPPLQLGSYLYEARTTQAARMQGNVVASGITWACQGNVCSTRGPWPRPGVAACRALASEVGVMASYGRSGAMLTAAELAECNAGLAAQSTPIRPSIQITPTAPVVRPIAPPASQSGDASAPTGSASGAVTVDASELFFVGGAAVDTSDRAATAVVVNAGELNFVGGAIVATADRAAPAVVVNSSELSLVGR